MKLNETKIAEAFRARPFQKEGALFAQRNKRVLIADEPGLGKTIQAIAATVGAGTRGSVLVVAPKTAVYVTWPAELRRWIADIAPRDKMRIIGGKLNKHQRNIILQRILEFDNELEASGEDRRQWVVVSPNYLRYDIQLDDHGRFVYDENGDKIILPVREAMLPLRAIEWSAIIVDEAHLTLAGATNNIKKQSAQSRGIRLLETKDDALRLALSGTPFRGKQWHLWGILNWLEPENYTAYWEWTKEHFNQYVDPVWGTTILGDLKSETKFYEEISHLMIRRTKGEVAKDLPPKMYGGTPLFTDKKGKDGPVAVWLDIEGKQRSAYDEMASAAMAKLEGGTLIANGVLAEIIRLKQFSNSLGFLDDSGHFYPKLPSNKFDWLVEFLAERGIDGKGPGVSKVVVASQFTRHIKLFAKELEKLKIPSFQLTGETPDQLRVEYQKAFQTNKWTDDMPAPDVFLLNTKAGGVSLTLDAADDCVLIDSTFNPDDQEQVEDRIHRISRMHNVGIWNLASTKTIDESIARETQETRASIKQILDGERGVEFAIKLLKDSA